MFGSSFDQGDQASYWRKSLTTLNTASGGALMMAERETFILSDWKEVMPQMTAMMTTRPSSIFLNMGG